MGHSEQRSKLVCVKNQHIWINNLLNNGINSNDKQKGAIREERYGNFVIIPINTNDLKVSSDSSLKPADDYKCSSPPWFTLTLSFLQVKEFYSCVHFQRSGILCFNKEQTICLGTANATIQINMSGLEFND